MKFAHELMSSKEVQKNKIGTFTERNSRSDWACTVEGLVRELAPFPCSYDVNPGQPTNFSEFTYTELLSGMWVSSQSLEINCRLMQLASEVESTEHIDLTQLVADKYKLDTDLGSWSGATNVCFLPGHNALDIASVEVTSRLAHEQPDVVFKPHPITNDDALSLVGTRFGWNRIVPKDVSGNALLANCENVYTTTASEMALSGTILGKRVHNVSNFFNEGSGIYHCISRILFPAHKISVELAQRKLQNIFNCEWSGIVTHLHNDPEKRLRSYYTKVLELREMYRPIAAPKGGPKK